MSTPTDQLGASAAIPDAGALTIGPGDDWILSTGIEDQAESGAAPLPSDADPGADNKPPTPEADETQPKPDEIATDKEAIPPAPPDPVAPAKVEAKPDAQPDATTAKPEVVTDPELSTEDNALVNALPEAERPGMTGRLKRLAFMDHYLNPDKPAEDIRKHLEERSPSRYGEVESAMFAHRFAQPDQALSELFKQDAQLYSKVAMAVFNGDQKFFAEQITGRNDLAPEQVKEAIAFWERNKDAITDDGQSLSDVDEDTIAEIEKYFPDKVPLIKQALEAGKKAQTENATLKTQLEDKGTSKPDEQPGDPANDPQVVHLREVNRLWDLGRNTVGEYFWNKAANEQTGIGINVSAQERKDAPLVALLKDFKATVFGEGLIVDGKTVVPDLAEGFTNWGKERDGFKDRLTHMDRFTQAREENNVLDVAKQMFPFAEVYYGERLKHPIFSQIDQLISLATKNLQVAPKVDPQIPGSLPSKGATQGAGIDDWLVNDAVRRAGG